MKRFLPLFVAISFSILFAGMTQAQTLSQAQLIEAAQSKSVYLGLQSRGANFFETQAAFNAYWDGKELFLLEFSSLPMRAWWMNEFIPFLPLTIPQIPIP